MDALVLADFEPRAADRLRLPVGARNRRVAASRRSSFHVFRLRPARVAYCFTQNQTLAIPPTRNYRLLKRA